MIQSALLLVLLLLSGCAGLGIGSCAGSPATATSDADLSCWAGKGDKQAQYALGQMYEFGTGVPQDLKRARKLYSAAASVTPNTVYVYLPPVGKESYGRVLPKNAGPPTPGLPEAKEALERVERKLNPESEGTNAPPR